MAFLPPPSHSSSSGSSTATQILLPKNVFVWVGMKSDDILKKDANLNVEYLRDLPKPSAYIVMVRKPGMQPHKRTWYHCIGTEFQENDHHGGVHDYWHHVINEDRYEDNKFCERVIPCGTFPGEKFELFEKCFYATPPQHPPYFMLRFLRKLVQMGILPGFTTNLYEDLIKELEGPIIEDPALDGERVDPTPLKELDEFEEQMMFSIEL
ncbi:hypothetical protein BJY00DRAFT_313810 [Aspergillus carlsbadensis]|nr:hypothetical protein BJY00DRAFT_313810 [Aspergillus carlsbadensis]